MKELEEELRGIKREEIIIHARDWRIKNISHKRKEELIDEVSKLRRRMVRCGKKGEI